MSTPAPARPRRVLFFGGNGHCAARLEPAREAKARLVEAGAIEAFEIQEVGYPGFEGRPRAASLEAFLEDVRRQAEVAAGIAYATGIGGLLALGLRARGALESVPLLLQAPVLWGLEHRLLPRLMRLRLLRAAARWALARPAFQRRFARRHFARPIPEALSGAFFAGYARCDAFGDLFAWMTPGFLRCLERELRERPTALRDISVWWGGRDRVVGRGELALTERSLGARWPLQVYAEWGHYPMIDEPEVWVRALSAQLDRQE